MCYNPRETERKNLWHMKITNLIENTAGTAGCVPAHGLSFHIETASHKILFDAGPSDETLWNAEKLGIDVRNVDIAVLSHGHYDHSGGLAAFAGLNPTASLYMQRTAAGEHYAFDGTDAGYRYIGIDKSLSCLPQTRLVDGDLRIDDEISLFTVSRRIHPVPDTNSRILVKSQERYHPDDFQHEQCLYIRSEGSSALLSGCAHNGILNIMEEFVRKFGQEHLPDVVVSGFHLLKKDGYNEDDFAGHEAIARRLAEYPCTFCTCHCTDTAPYERMKKIMGGKLRYIRTGETV